MRFVTCAPVEYLTYEIRNISDLMRLVGVDAHIDPLLLAFSKARRGGRPRAAVRGAGALRMRHTPCGCCPPTAPEARNLFRIHQRAIVNVRPQLSLRGHTFFCLARKKYAKKRRRMRSIALTRRKTNRYALRISVTLQVKERPSGDRRIGFPERTIYSANRSVNAR